MKLILKGKSADHDPRYLIDVLDVPCAIQDIDVFLAMSKAIVRLPRLDEARFYADEEAMKLLEKQASLSKGELRPWKPGEPAMAYRDVPIEMIP